MPSESVTTSSLNVNNGSSNECTTNPPNSVRKISYDPTEYVQKARVTKAAPPPPAYNPLQFVAVKPVKLYKTAEEQLKKAEETKITKEVKKEDAEEWQSNLDNWKCSRRKRVEHIIDRVVEVKKLELEEHDRNRRKSKTFSEMMEERGGRRKISVPIYQDDDGNNFSDLGISTSSTSGKSSLSEDYDNESVTSDVAEEKSVGHHKTSEKNIMKSSCSDCAASTESQDFSEYTYEAAIENYKSRVMKVASSSSYSHIHKEESVASSRKRSEGSKLEERLLSMEMKLNSNDTEEKEKPTKKDLPKVDIAKRRELFEKTENAKVDTNEKHTKTPKSEIGCIKSIKERMSDLKPEENQSTFNIDVNISNVRERFLILEKNVNPEPLQNQNKVDVPLSVTLKDRLSSLQSCVNLSNNAKANNNIDKEKVTILNNDPVESQTNSNYEKRNDAPVYRENIETVDTDREDSGIHTTDVSCSVSQVDEQIEERIEDLISVNIEMNNRIEETSERNVIEIQINESLCPKEESYNMATTTTGVDEVKHQKMKNSMMPDLIQHNNVPVPLSAENIRTEEYHEENVSLSLSESTEESVGEHGTLLLDVKSIIDNLVSTTISDKVEESSIHSHDFEETTTFNTMSIFDETTVNDDDSSVISSVPSPYRSLSENNPNNGETKSFTTLTTPSLNLNLTSIKANIELSPYSPDETPNNELVLDYFNKSPSKKTDTSSPRSPSRSILNFIKTNLLNSSNDQTVPQESSKFYVTLNDPSKQTDSKNNLEMSIKSQPVLEKNNATELNTTTTYDINSALEEEMLKL